MNGSRERQVAPPAVGARREPERALGRDVDRVPGPRVEAARKPVTRSPGEADLGIAGTAEGAKRRRLDDLDLVPHGEEPLAQLDEHRHHAVELRCPGVGDDRDPHASTVSGISTAAGGAGVDALRDRCSDHSRISSRPSACSASAVRLSTQSPSLA